MPAVVRVNSIAQLNRLLTDGKPTVVVLPPHKPTEQAVKDGLHIAPDRSILTCSELYTYPVMTFHQAEAKLGLTDLLRDIEIAPDKAVLHP